MKENTTTQRLDQFIAHATGLSRKDAKSAIRRGRVKVNGSTIKSTAEKINTSDLVKLGATELQAFSHKYYALNKPANYCCSHEDDGAPSALRLLPSSTQKLLFAGRLDTDTTGLIFISTDGKWCHRVSHPNKQQANKNKTFGKVYAATLAETFTAADKSLISDGIILKNESKPTLPCHIEIIHDKLVHIEIFEGKYHQVKRMFAATGNKVESLQRISIHGIHLAPLIEGECRELSPEEIELFTPTAVG